MVVYGCEFVWMWLNGFLRLEEVCGRYMGLVVFFDVLEIIKLLRKRKVDKTKL